MISSLLFFTQTSVVVKCTFSFSSYIFVFVNNFLAAICALLLNETSFISLSLLQSTVSASTISFILKGRGALFFLNFLYLLTNFLAAISALLLDETSFIPVSLLKSIVSASATSFILKGRGAFFRDIFLYFCTTFLAAIYAFLFLLFITFIFLGVEKIYSSSLSAVLFLFLLKFLYLLTIFFAAICTPLLDETSFIFVSLL